jgi:hypothetical protein
MTHVILGLQELGIYSRETFTLVSTSRNVSVFTLRFDAAKIEPAEITSLVTETGGQIVGVDEEERKGNSSESIPRGNWLTHLDWLRAR